MDKTENEIIAERNNKIFLKNVAIQKSRTNMEYPLSAGQSRLWNFIRGRINPKIPDAEYSFSIREYCDIVGLSPDGNTYDDIKRDIKAIADYSIWIEMDGGEQLLIRPICGVGINSNTGIVKYRIFPDYIPFVVFENFENFTMFNFEFTIRFKCKHSFRLYELAKSHAGQKKPFVLSVEQLKERMYIQRDRYEKYTEFYRNVIKKAIEEINEFSDITVSVEPIIDQYTRKTVKLQFSVHKKPLSKSHLIADETNKVLDENRSKQTAKKKAQQQRRNWKYSYTRLKGQYIKGFQKDGFSEGDAEKLAAACLVQMLPMLEQLKDKFKFEWQNEEIEKTIKKIKSLEEELTENGESVKLIEERVYLMQS